MKKRFLTLSLAVGIIARAAFSSHAGELEDLSGKWSCSKTNSEGAAYKQVIDFKKDTFVFQIVDSAAKVLLYAEGKVKLDKAGGLRVLKLSDIQYGRSKDDLQPIDDDRTDVYTIRDDKLLLVSNFDKERDNQEPQVDTYVKVAAKPAETPASKAKSKE